MKFTLFTLCLIPFLLVKGQAENDFNVKMGITGFGVGYERELNTKLSAKASISYLNVAPSFFFKGSINQHRVKALFNFAQLELAAKWYPKAKTSGYGITSSNRFFIIGGLLLRDNGNYFFYSDYQRLSPGNSFNKNDTLTGRLNFKLNINVLQPFLGIGHEIIPKDHKWSFSIEAALSYHGTSPTIPNVNFYETGKIKLFENQFNRWVQVPNIIKLLKVYPQLNVNFGYRF
jgi:hypothetical protein